MKKFSIYKGKSCDGKLDIKRKIGECLYVDKSEIFSLYISGLRDKHIFLVPQKDPNNECDFAIIMKKSEKEFEHIGAASFYFYRSKKYIKLDWNIYGDNQHYIDLDYTGTNLSFLRETKSKEVTQAA